MKLTVKDFLGLDALKGCQLLAGKGEVERPVSHIAVLDEVDLEMGVERKKEPEQFVITHFWSSAGDTRAQADAVRALGEKKASALLIYLNEKGVKEVSKEVIEAAEEVKLPLIAVNDAEDESNSYSKLIAESHDKYLYGDKYYDNVLNKSMYHLLNFSKYRSFPVALREAAVNNDFQVILMTEEYNTILTVETRHLVKIEEIVMAGRKIEALSSGSFKRLQIESIITYWGYVNIQDKRYILVIVDNEGQFASLAVPKLAQSIEVAIGMWKYTPDRDSRSEFIKSAIRGDLSFCLSLLDEAELRDKQFSCVFHIRDIGKDKALFYGKLEELKRNEGLGLLTINEEGNIYGIVYDDEGRDNGIDAKIACIEIFEELKAYKKEARIFHVTGMETLGSCVDAFKMITSTAGYMSKVFPYKRVFTKYEISMVYDCVSMHDGAQDQLKMYLELLEPFQREVSKSKGKMLIDTLSTFVLDAGMNSAKTAGFMNVHNNTVQYRLKKANEILGAEMTANRVIPGLTMALALNRLEEE